jgi:hypothetical protein
VRIYFVSNSTSPDIMTYISVKSIHERNTQCAICRKPSRFTEVTFLKILQTVKPRCAKWRPYGKNGVGGTEHTRNVKICILRINKHQDTCVGVHWDDVGAPGWKLSGRSKEVDSMAKGRTVHSVKTNVIIKWRAFCMSLSYEVSRQPQSHA